MVLQCQGCRSCYYQHVDADVCRGQAEGLAGRARAADTARGRQLVKCARALWGFLTREKVINVRGGNRF